MKLQLALASADVMCKVCEGPGDFPWLLRHLVVLMSATKTSTLQTDLFELSWPMAACIMEFASRFPRFRFVSKPAICLQGRQRRFLDDLDHVSSGRSTCAVQLTEAAKYRGVRYDRGKFTAQLYLHGHETYLGRYDSAELAAHAFDKRLRIVCAHDKHRLQRSLNFPSEEEAAYAETPAQARVRGLKICGSNHRKELEAFQLLEKALATSTSANGYMIRRLSDASRADAVFTSKEAPDCGLRIQLKSASSRERRGHTYHFSRVCGYDGMLVIFVALDGNHIWAAAGNQLLRRDLRITIGHKHDKQLRVHDICSHLVACFQNAQQFPHACFQDALLQCPPKLKTEALVHIQLCSMFRTIDMELIRLSLHNSPADSLLEVSACKGSRVCLRLQEKAAHMHGNSYRVFLWKHGGALGRLPYDDGDFDVLAACLLDQDKLQGVFLIPMSTLAHRGCANEKPLGLSLHPPWCPPKTRCTQLKYSWQLQYFVDLRLWQSSGELPAASREHLKGLILRNASE